MAPVKRFVPDVFVRVGYVNSSAQGLQTPQKREHLLTTKILSDSVVIGVGHSLLG